jgi:DNA-binding SARP family transcriptional activator/predicted ATPase
VEQIPQNKISVTIPPLTIQLLGDFRIVYGEKNVTGVNTPRLQSLLAYLVMHRAAPHSRQHLAFIFWPHSTEAQARTNLRNQLYHLRRALPDADRFLHVDVKTLQWGPDAAFTLDVAEFERAIAQAHEAEQASSRDTAPARGSARGAGHQTAVRAALEEAVGLYRGDLLPGCYDNWILPLRERLSQAFLRALERLIELLEAQRDYPTAIRYAQRLLRHDPLHEAAYRQLMRLRALSGDRAGALRAYHTCATVLQRELTVEPSPATREMYERLLNVETQAEPGARPPAALAASPPLVGRHQEWQQLQAAWRRAARGRPHLVLVAGETGIGKTRLAEDLIDWAAHQGIATSRTRSYAAEGALAYAPVAAWLRSDALGPALSALEDMWLTEVARVLPELLAERADLPAPSPLTERWQRQRLFEALARAILASGQSLLLVIDDLQWCDQETLEWLHYLLRFDPQARLLIVGTYRPEEIGPEHPLTSLRLALRRSQRLTEIELKPLDAADTAALAAHVAGGDLPPALAARIYEETEGNPLFVVETVRAGLPGDSDSDPPSLSLSLSLSLSPKVQAVIQARLVQLSPPARGLASLAATIGREFTFDVLARASDGDEDALVRGLDELWQRRIVREQGADAYDFSHDKIREVAYAGLSAARRRLLHRRVAQALESVHAADLDVVSGQLASHYERAGRPAQAIPYYQRAAEVESRISAYDEAIDHLTHGLALLRVQPATPQCSLQELTLQIALGSVYSITKGNAAPEVGEAYSRALTLCRQAGEAAHLFPVLWGLWAFHAMRAELHTAWELGEQLLSLAEKEQNPAHLLEAHRAVGVTLIFLGEFATARGHLERALAIYNPDEHHAHAFLYGQDPGLVCLAYLTHALWLLGYPDQALEKIDAAVTLAREMSHPLGEAFALGHAAFLHQWRREAQAAQERVEAAMTRATELGFELWTALLPLSRGWALAEQGQMQEGTEETRHGVAGVETIKAELARPLSLLLLAEAYGKAGLPEEGLSAVAQALATVDQAGERYCEAELYRLKGELLLRCIEPVEMMPAEGDRGVSRNAPTEAESCFQHALAVAHRQRAKSLELRAAVNLSRLWQRQGKPAEARRLLADIYRWFSEGFDTGDLMEARALLEDLSAELEGAR